MMKLVSKKLLRLILLPMILLTCSVTLITHLTPPVVEPMICLKPQKVSKAKRCILKNILTLNGNKSRASALACTTVIYNRVGKCGSSSVAQIFKRLACRNGFRFRMLTDVAPESVYANNAASFIRSIMHEKTDYLYIRHMDYINFSRVGQAQPIHINLIRDPLEQLISTFQYNIYGFSHVPRKEPVKGYNMSLDECVRRGHGPCWQRSRSLLPYFCGHDDACRKRDEAALNRAMKSVENDFLLVGMTEDMPAFMDALSYLLPHFFKDAPIVYETLGDDLWQRFKTAKKPDVKQETKDILRKFLKVEFTFYEFVRQRFYKLYDKIKKARTKEQKKNLTLKNQSKN